MKRKRSLQGVFLMEKCEMKGLIKTDSVIVILYFVKIYTCLLYTSPSPRD